MSAIKRVNRMLSQPQQLLEALEWLQRHPDLSKPPISRHQVNPRHPSSPPSRTPHNKHKTAFSTSSVVLPQQLLNNNSKCSNRKTPASAS